MTKRSCTVPNQPKELTVGDFLADLDLLPGPTPTPVLSILVGGSLDVREGELVLCGDRGAGGGAGGGPIVSGARREEDVGRRGV